MNLADITAMAHRFAADHLAPGDHAIDATAGNGKDLLFLAKAVGPTGKVYGFDIQPAALSCSRQTLETHGLTGTVELIQDSHTNMVAHLPAGRERITVILFNLGYLPGGDETVTTSEETTLPALATACDLLAPGGLLSVVVYPGHAAGMLEAQVVEQWSETLDAARYASIQYRLMNRSACPWILLVEKH